ncbi:hypothetical protein ACFQU1_13475 [Chelatococcus sp. GCM10030263]
MTSDASSGADVAIYYNRDEAAARDLAAKAAAHGADACPFGAP